MDITKGIVKFFVDWTKLKVRIHTAEEVERYFYEREIWWASLGANIGFEQNGKNDNFERPILVLKKFNQYVLWALPLTSQEKEGQYYFPTEYNGEKSFVILSQLRLISSKRLLRNIRMIPESEFLEVRKRIKDFL